jgi:hypothetical protein
MYTVCDRIFGDFPAQNTVYTPYTYGMANYILTLYTSSYSSLATGLQECK